MGSVLIRYLWSLGREIEHVSFFCDSCGGQNRNQYSTAALANVVKMCHFKTVSINFLEPGHTQMECDSMHSAIECEKKNTDVFSLEDLLNVFLKARCDNPYDVVELGFQDFYDLKKLSSAIILEKNKNTEGEKINWLKIRTIMICKGRENLIYYNDAGVNERLKKFNINGKSSNFSSSFPALSKLYTEHIHISLKKYDDLMYLCNKNVIPNKYHDWYRNLPLETVIVVLTLWR